MKTKKVYMIWNQIQKQNNNKSKIQKSKQNNWKIKEMIYSKNTKINKWSNQIYKNFKKNNNI